MTASHGATDQADTLRQLAGRAKGQRSDALDRLQMREGLRVISVTSGKGGVGKSSVVVNLAESLAALGKRVLIVDANAGVGDICLRLGKEAPYRLNQVLSGERTLEENVIDGGTGISILPAGMGVQQYTSLSPTERFSLLQGMMQLEDRFDFFLIDTGAGISANVTSFAAVAREIVLVVTPEPSSITDAYALVKTLSGRDGSLHFRILVNMCRDAEEGAALFAKLSAITGRFLQVSMDYSGCILHDEMLVESVRRRGALCRLYPDAKASLGFRALAQKISAAGSSGAVAMPIDPVAGRKQWRNHELSS
ncbi:MAG: cobyrinic acid a,c-diamide synthase [Geobacteraceae bacterium GWC2_58_44]|nr:MAG: cobyrinic acid a,c-diamide synthase [Geobacteraceae bacterium GWC2_58_44]